MRALSASPTGRRGKGGWPLCPSPWQLPRQRQAPVVTLAKVKRLDRSEGYGQAPVPALDERVHGVDGRRRL